MPRGQPITEVGPSKATFEEVLVETNCRQDVDDVGRAGDRVGIVGAFVSEVERGA